MKVYLVRHGKALHPQTDPAQPLSEEGRAEIRHMARTLANMNLKVGNIIHSSKLRAEETAKEIAEAVQYTGIVRPMQGLSPNDDPADLLELIETAEEDMIVVSHLPLLDKILEALLKPSQGEKLPSFDTGAVVGLEKTDGKWQIFRRLGPRMIY